LCREGRGGGKTKKLKGGASFTPIILYNQEGNKVYQCPICHIISGTAIVQDPQNLDAFNHANNCENRGKFPIEDQKQSEQP
jgi:hypothetical protein